MKIVHTCGGLANQMRQYIFMRYLEEATNQEFIISDFGYFTNYVQHNGFELDKIFPNIKLKTLSQILSVEVTKEIIQQSKEKKVNSINLLSSYGVDITTTVTERVIWMKPNQFDSFSGNKVKINGSNDVFGKTEEFQYDNVYYIGYWGSCVFFDQNKELMLQELEFQPIPDEKNQGYFKSIKATQSVGVHIRRGDFVNIGWDLPAEKYIPAIRKLREQITAQNEIPHYFIITNDLDWCQENTFNLGFLLTDNLTFIEGNTTDSKNYIDMQLMSHCKYLISNSRSSFSSVAGWLNKDLIEHIRLTESEEERAIRLINSNPYEKILELENTVKSVSDKYDVFQKNTLDIEKNISNLQLENKTMLERLDKHTSLYDKKLDSVLHSKDNEITQLREQLHSAKLEIVRHKEQAIYSQKQVSQHKGEVAFYKKEVNKYKGQVRYHKRGKEDIIHSLSYKLGRAITWLPRKVIGIFIK